jgi:hypothetical protein
VLAALCDATEAGVIGQKAVDECCASRAASEPSCAAELAFLVTPSQLVSLVESLLDKLRFIPQPEAQERYLAGADTRHSVFSAALLSACKWCPDWQSH